MQETTPQALTPDEAAEVMGHKSHTVTPAATPPEPKTATPPEPFYFYNVVVTVQKRSGWIKKDGKGVHVDYKPFKLKCLINTNAYSKIKPAALRFFDKWLDDQDAYIKNYDIRKMDVDCLIPQP